MKKSEKFLNKAADAYNNFKPKMEEGGDSTKILKNNIKYQYSVLKNNANAIKAGIDTLGTSASNEFANTTIKKAKLDLARQPYKGAIGRDNVGNVVIGTMPRGGKKVKKAKKNNNTVDR
jgi:hypothetical protein